MQYSVEDGKELQTSLTKEKFEELKELVLKNLSLDRQKLVWKFPFTGGVAMKLDVVPVRDVRVRTACTDGTRIYVDIGFYSKLSESDRMFIFAHEVWHVVMMHMLRRQTRMPELFNVATDMEINYLLSKEGLPCPDFVLYPEGKMIGLSAEEIYELLLKKMNKNSKKQKSNQCGSSSSGGSQCGDDDDSSCNNDIYNDYSSRQNRYKSDAKELEGQFDKHVYSNDVDDENEGNGDNGKGGKSDGNDKGGSGVTDQWGEVGYDSDYHPTISKDLADKIRESVVESAQSVQRNGRGTVPAAIASYIDAICKPEISWKELLSQFVTSCYNGQRQWLPVNRRHVYNDIYLQSRRDEQIKVTVAIDTSGSCQTELPKFLGELIALLQSFGKYELNLLQCDAEVDDYKKYDDSNPFDFDYTKFKFCGGGGTDFTPVFDYVRDNAIETDCLVYFTDGYGSVMSTPPPYPTMWLITKSGTKDFCEWGTKVQFKHDK